jgi:CDP-glycerol glycerophosphotransferase (TagB/SpsB family)/glycosyltransferase involved in cell wall biosynthesis
MSVKVSVIVAIHRFGINLDNSLNALKNQSLKDIEILLIDASTNDGTADVMKKYLSDKRFRYIKLDSDSISLARNNGIKEAKGKYIAFADKNVIFSSSVIENLFQTAEKQGADLTVAPMASSDIYGKHNFTSSSILLRRNIIDKFDTDLIWNGAVTNKLFLKSKIEKHNITFKPYGKARESAFTMSYVFESDKIVACSKGMVSYITPVSSEGVSEVNIENYLSAYEYIIRHATEAFTKAINESVSDFDRKELKKQMVCYIDQIYHKEITVLLYSYYRHFWILTDSEIAEYAEIIMSLCDRLSDSGRRLLEEKNKDIFYDSKLLSSRKLMAENPKVTVCICKGENSITKETMNVSITSIYTQTMPSFELFVHSELRDIFPEKWMNMPNVTFIDAETSGEFKDIALEKSTTGYIMYQDSLARLNPKMLMRHYTALEGKDKYGFSTSPLTRFDGEKTTEYLFSELSYYSNIKQTRTKENNCTYALDLFFCNKLFRTEHLNGIHFHFSENTVLDIHKLYTHSRFKKLSHRGVYLPYREEQVISHLKKHNNILPVPCRLMLKKYKRIAFKDVTLKKAASKAKSKISAIYNYLIKKLVLFFTVLFSTLKIRDRVFFYSSRSDKEFMENLRAVYKKYPGEKVSFCKKGPHSLKDLLIVRKYLLTSKVIVTDDYIDCLRYVRLRPEQKLIQVWYTGGAFRRFGLDNPHIGSRLDEYKAHSQYSAVCVSSEYMRQVYAHAFGVDIDIVKATGTPRSDVIVNDAKIAEKKKEICFKHPLLKDKKVYVYFPSYRDKDGEITDFNPKIDFAKLNDDLEDDEVFVLCRHPFMKQEYIKGSFYPRVKDYTDDPTPELIAVADVVLTDFSTIVFDASLLNKPMVFYEPDIEKCKADLYLRFEKDLPGETVTDSAKLLAALRRAVSAEPDTIFDKFKDREMGMCDGKATKRVIELINSYLKD